LVFLFFFSCDFLLFHVSAVTDVHQQMHNILFAQLYYIKTLKSPTCFDPCVIIFRQSVGTSNDLV